MKKMLIAGNWKMHTNAFESVKLAEYIAGGIAEKNLKQRVLICPPFTSLIKVQEAIDGSQIQLGAQNCHFEEKGAFTGEISIPMISYLGCTYVILGHSERRTYFHEDDDFINKKVLAALNGGIKPLLCIGETLDERKNGQTFDILERQLKKGLANIPKTGQENIVIAYEPVWAIGTGINATPEQVAEAHGFIRKTLGGVIPDAAQGTEILYGGSVNVENAQSILALDDVNGALIGGASLKAESFLTIINTAEDILKQ